MFRLCITTPRDIRHDVPGQYVGHRLTPVAALGQVTSGSSVTPTAHHSSAGTCPSRGRQPRRHGEEQPAARALIVVPARDLTPLAPLPETGMGEPHSIVGELPLSASERGLGGEVRWPKGRPTPPRAVSAHDQLQGSGPPDAISPPGCHLASNTVARERWLRAG
jgi:hypothetical protein